MKRVLLGDHVEFLSGFAFKSKLFNDSGDGLPLVRIRDVVRGYSDTYYSGVYDRKYLVRAGDYLIGMDGEFNLSEWDSEVALLNQRVCKISEVSSEIHRPFLAHYLRIALKEIEDATPFVTVKHLSIKKLGAIEIPLPPLSEQKRIAAILDVADVLRAKRRKSIIELDRLVQATFLEMFGDPVKNPKEWPIEPFGQIGKSRLGKMLDKKKQTGNHLRPYLANFNVQWDRFDFSQLREMDFDKNDREEFSLRSGDLLICEGGDIGRSAIWREDRGEIYFQKALHRVRLDKQKASPEYILYYMWFMSQNGGFREFTSSATIAHLTGVKLKKLPVPLPPVALQMAFSKFYLSLNRLKSNVLDHLAKLDLLFASLQSRAFQGEL